MRRKIFIAIFILTILLCMPIAVSTEIIDSGECGKDGANVTWTLDDESTLTISGEGDMGCDYYFPWYGTRLNITKAVIEQGVTSISCC